MAYYLTSDLIKLFAVGKWLYMSSSNYRTPDYAHVYNYNDVYEPCEDTFLMLDALEKDCDFLKKLRLETNQQHAFMHTL